MQKDYRIKRASLLRELLKDTLKEEALSGLRGAGLSRNQESMSHNLEIPNSLTRPRYR